MANGNNKRLKAWVRYDGTGRVIPGGPILQANKPKVGNWKEIDAYECCNPSGSTTTTTTSTTQTPTTTTTTTLSPIAFAYINDVAETMFVYQVDQSKYQTFVTNNYSAFTHIAPGDTIQVGTTLYLDSELTTPWPFAVTHVAFQITDVNDVNPSTVVWKVENGIITQNLGAISGLSYSVLSSVAVQDSLVACGSFFPSSTYVDNGVTALSTSINVYSGFNGAGVPQPLSWNYITDNVNIYQITAGVITSNVGPC